MKSVAYFFLISVVTLVGHYYFYTESKINRIQSMLDIVEQKDKINNDQVIELMNKLREFQIEKEATKSASYVAGVLDMLSRPDHYNAIWHNGYDRGTDVQQQMAQTIEKHQEGFKEQNDKELIEIPTNEGNR